MRRFHDLLHATFFVAVWLACVAPAFAQTALPHPQEPGEGLKAADYEAATSIPAEWVAGKDGAVAAATFNVTFSSNFPAEARAAFQRAVDIWAAHLQSPVTVNVRADWAALGENTLGSAGPTNVYANRPQFPVQDTWYPAALAEAMVGLNLNSINPDIRAQFSSEFTNWYFGTDARPPSGTYDFVTVVLHELGHGLGFTGTFGVEDSDPSQDPNECDFAVPAGFGCWGISLSETVRFPIIFDHFAEDVNDISLLNENVYPNPSAALGAVLQSDRVFFDGLRSRRINTDVPISLYAPSTFESGSSFSHLDEVIFPSGTLNSLMTPQLARSEAIHTPGPLTCAMFEDMGWPLGQGCFNLLPSPVEQHAGGLAIQAPYPNPFNSRAEIVLTVDRPQRVQVEVYNVAGQRVAMLPARHVSSSAPERITLEGADWPAGLYLVRLTGETFSHTEKLVRVR